MQSEAEIRARRISIALENVRRNVQIFDGILRRYQTFRRFLSYLVFFAYNEQSERENFGAYFEDNERIAINVIQFSKVMGKKISTIKDILQKHGFEAGKHIKSKKDWRYYKDTNRNFTQQFIINGNPDELEEYFGTAKRRLH